MFLPLPCDLLGTLPSKHIGYRDSSVNWSQDVSGFTQMAQVMLTSGQTGLLRRGNQTFEQTAEALCPCLEAISSFVSFSSTHPKRSGSKLKPAASEIVEK